MSLPDVLLVLTAAGLLHLDSSVFAGDPVRGHPIPSLLNLPTVSPKATAFGERLQRDLELLLGAVYSLAASLVRMRSKLASRTGPRIVRPRRSRRSCRKRAYRPCP